MVHSIAYMGLGCQIVEADSDRSGGRVQRMKLTLTRALAENRLEEFVQQAEAAGVPPADSSAGSTPAASACTMKASKSPVSKAFLNVGRNGFTIANPLNPLTESACYAQYAYRRTEHSPARRRPHRGGLSLT